MFAGWMILGMILGGIAAVVIWALLIALVVVWYEDRHQKHAR
jgi:hypothetical protein